MHTDQIPLDADVVRALIREQFADDEPVEPVETSATTSYVFRVGAAHSARFPMRKTDALESRRVLEREQEAMDRFARASTVPSPRIVFVGRPGRGYPLPWSVQTWIEGEVATPRSGASSHGFARDLADLIGALRTVDPGGRVFSGSGRGGRLADHDEWVEHCLRRSESLLPVPRLRDAWGSLGRTGRTEPDVMSHKDLTPFNLVVRDGRLLGVLDTGDFGPADPALDLVVAWHLLEDEARIIFRERLGVDRDQWARGSAWALQQALGLVWYYERTNPAMSDLGRSTLERILRAPEFSL